MLKESALQNEGVLIAGAGPTGLTLALQLAAFGVPFTIIDLKSGPSSDSKGLALNVATQYGLTLAGVRDRIGLCGQTIRRLNVLWEGKRFFGIDFRHLKAPFASLITQPQSNTELELLATLEDLGHRVEWRTKLLSASQDSEGVEALVEDENGQRRTRRFAYAVGCEGKHSVLRKQIGAELQGHDYPMYFVLGDFRLIDPIDLNQVYYHVYENTFFILVPISETLCRIVIKRDGTPPNEPVKKSDVTEVLAQYVGEPFVDGDPVWLSRAPFYMRTCDRLRDRRLFIAGDAAHLYSPIGGTGMNTGMQDALNLGWKLALCSKGLAHDALLDSYQSERLEAIVSTAKMTDLSTKLIAEGAKHAQAVEPFRPKMANRDFFRRVLPRKQAGIDVRYTKPIAAGQENDARAEKVGTLCLFLDSALQGVAAKHRAFVKKPLTLIARFGHADCERIRQSLRPGLDALHAYRHALNVIALTNLESTADAVSDGIHYLGADLIDSDWLDLDTGSMLLAYPDGYIGFCSAIEDFDGLSRLLQHFFKPLAQPASPCAADTSGAHDLAYEL